MCHQKEIVRSLVKSLYQLKDGNEKFNKILMIFILCIT